MSYCKELKTGLESLFSMPFDVVSEDIDNEVIYHCYPSNEGETLFEVSIHIHNKIRIVAEITPQKHAGELLYELECASKDKIDLFFDYYNALIALGAKVQFLVNNSILLSSHDWKKHWRSFSCRLTKIPLTEDNDEYNEAEILLLWAKHCFCWFFSALTISDCQEYSSLREPDNLKEYGRLEGNKYQVITNRYERNTINRELCLAKKGYKCVVCGFDFKDRYGSIGKNYIEVHHVIPVSMLGPDYHICIDTDLEPVCSNCHAMLHRKNPPLLPNELKQCMNEASKHEQRDNAIVSKYGVLLVMMENFADKASKFVPMGKIAIGIKYTKDSMEIVEHLSEIGYMLFHTRKDVGQHLYKVTNKVVLLSEEKIPANVYRNISTAKMYAVVEFETVELDSSSIHSSRKVYTPETRYDAQYSIIEELRCKE